MTVYILNSLIKKRNYDGVVLNEYDFHPCHPFFMNHLNIQPESVDRIVIKGIFERCRYKRAVLRCCDYMLARGGEMEVYFYNAHFEIPLYVRARNDWQYEVSLTFGNRIRLREQKTDSTEGYFKYEKIGPYLPEDDTIDRWSFGIVSSGRMNDRVLNMISEIEALGIPEYEIIVCGPKPSDNLPSSVKVLSDSHLYPDIRIPISRKKNYIIDEAKFNNVVMMHDRYTIPIEWYNNMIKHGNYFDIMTCNMTDDSGCNRRMANWSWHTQKSQPQRLYEAIFSKNQGGLEPNEWNEYAFITGGYFVMKKHLGIKLNPECNWGEMEDVDFCHRAYQSGALLSYDPNNTMHCMVVRFNIPSLKNTLFGIRPFVSRQITKITRLVGYIKEISEYKHYLKHI